MEKKLLLPAHEANPRPGFKASQRERNLYKQVDLRTVFRQGRSIGVKSRGQISRFRVRPTSAADGILKREARAAQCDVGQRTIKRPSLTPVKIGWAP